MAAAGVAFISAAAVTTIAVIAAIMIMGAAYGMSERGRSLSHDGLE
jgi:hypothetical protein